MGCVQRKPAIPQLAIGGRFKGFGKEEEKSVIKTGAHKDSRLEQLKDAWREYCYERGDKLDEPRLLSLIQMLRYRAEDVEKFSLVMHEFQHEEDFTSKAGLFLSALMNNGQDDDYTIHTGHLREMIHELGAANRKNIIVKGDAGVNTGRNMEGGTLTVTGDVHDFVGAGMEGGRIIVEGNAGHRVGAWMSGGEILVKGDAERNIGDSMKGGVITIRGNASTNIGEMMSGGAIHLMGEYHHIMEDYTPGGKIYHKGRLARPTFWTIAKALWRRTFRKYPMENVPLKAILRDVLVVLKHLVGIKEAKPKEKSE